VNKGFIVQVVEERGKQHQVILCKFDLMDKNFKAVYKELYDIEIIVTHQEDIQINPMEATKPTQESKGTSFNPILIDEDPEQQ
jgi:hypothetical protein